MVALFLNFHFNVGSLNWVSKKRSNGLMAEGIVAIGDLCLLDGDKFELCSIIKKVKGMTHCPLKEMIASTQDVIPGPPPPAIYHVDVENPYQSKYGDGWEEEINKRSTCSGSVCFSLMIEHMVKVCQDTERWHLS